MPEIDQKSGQELDRAAKARSRIDRIRRLLQKLRGKRYRDAFVQTHTRQFLAQQMRAFRGERSQDEMGALLDKPQSVISRLEDASYGKWTLSTLFEISAKLDKALIVRFVDPQTFVKFSVDAGDVSQNPISFSDEALIAADSDMLK